MKDSTWTVPSRYQGQAVEVAYAWDIESNRLLRRTTDRSFPPRHEQRVSYAWADPDGLRGPWDPWNRVPDVRSDWVPFKVR